MPVYHHTHAILISPKSPCSKHNREPQVLFLVPARVLLIYWDYPAELENFLLPADINWSTRGLDLDMASGHNIDPNREYKNGAFPEVLSFCMRLHGACNGTGCSAHGSVLRRVPVL